MYFVVRDRRLPVPYAREVRQLDVTGPEEVTRVGSQVLRVGRRQLPRLSEEVFVQTNEMDGTPDSKKVRKEVLVMKKYEKPVLESYSIKDVALCACGCACGGNAGAGAGSGEAAN